MAEKVKLSDIALEVGKPAKEVLELAKEIGIQAKATSSNVDIEIANAFVGYFMGEVSKEDLSARFAPKPKAAKTKPKTEAKKPKAKEQDEQPSNTPLQEEPKEEDDKQEAKQHLVRRTGIRIVKKNTPQTQETKLPSIP